MYCPQCGAEYLRNATVCSDCQVALVREPPGQAQKQNDYGDESLKFVWSGDDPRKHAEVLRLLDHESIPASTMRRENSLFPIGRAEFSVFVPASLAEKANAIVNPEDSSQEESEAADDSSIEIAAEDSDQEQAQEVREPQDWHPEDATVEIWSGEDLDMAGMIAMSLRENEIHYRSNVDEAESETAPAANQKLYVVPEDEARAKEIVREIVEGAPQK